VPLKDVLQSLAVALLILAMGAVILAPMSSWRDRSEILWAVAIISIAAAAAILIYLAGN
jgi:hypothetical protein